MKNGNKILIIRKNGEIQEIPFILNLFTRIKGKNNVIKIYEPCKFKLYFGHKHSHIFIKGDNNVITFYPNQEEIKSIKILSLGSNNRVEFGENFGGGCGLKIDFAYQSNLSVKIGDNCLFGGEINLMLGDYHSVYSIKDGSVLNSPRKGISIGNHVWLAKGVTMLKDSGIGDNSVAALGSIITKDFTQKNVILAGSPAHVVKENINWGCTNTQFGE